MSRVKTSFALTVGLLALGASQTTLAQNCADLVFTDVVTDALPEAHRPYALGIYANALASKLALARGDLSPC